jgi:Tfp pilus assembly protein PilN
MKIPFLKTRPAHTLLFITEAKTFRIDVDKTGVMVGTPETITVKCVNTAALAECVNFIASNSHALASKTWLFFVRLPIHLLSIPSMQVEGVDEAMLLQALQFELEGLNGVLPQEQQYAYHFLNSKDEMSQYWVSQIDKIHFTETYQAIKKAKSHLQGILHPAAMPQPLHNWEEPDWLRIECWSQELVALRHHSENGLEMRLIAFNDSYWQNQLENWLDKQGEVEHSETLLNNKIEVLPETTVTVHLSDADNVASWLSLWAQLLVKDELPAVPILRHQSKVNADLVLMASGGVGALLIVSIHAGWNVYQENHYKTQIEQLTKVETTITAARKTVNDEREKVEKLKVRIEKLKKTGTVLPDLMQGILNRPAKLLEALAKGRPEKLMVETLGSDKDEIKITGISLDAVSPNELSNYLEQELKPLGWSVTAPTKKNLELLPNGNGPWEFEIKLTDLGMDGFNAKPSGTL